jgi:hypothetical protein
MTPYTSPPRPHVASATDAGGSEGHGALMIAETRSAPTRWTTVGVAKALIDSAVVRRRPSSRT